VERLRNLATLAPFAATNLTGTSAFANALGLAGKVQPMDAREWRACDSPAFVAQWDELAARAAEPNPFYESWYLLPSLRALDPQGKVALLCMEHGGQLAGLMPIRRHPAYYGYPLPHLRNWVHDNCFCGTPLVAKGMEAAFWRAVLAWCDANAQTGLFLHLMQLPASGPVYQGLTAKLASTRRAAATVLSEERALLCSDQSPADYFEASLTAKKRKELRRQHRRLAEEGTLEVVRERGSTGVQQWTEQFLELEARGWKGRAGSSLAADPANAALFLDSLAGAARRDRLERLSLVMDGRPIAMLATFLTPPGAFSYKTAFDEDFARYSPGVLLQREALDLIEAPEVEWIDSCAAPDHAMIDHIWRERRRIARHSIAVGGPLRRRLFSILSRRETGRAPGGVA
jgi:CelD/BcsL family acetyltransferase involved in cellulose biosynthesis